MATLASGRRGGSSPGTAPEWGISHRSAREMMAEIERLREALKEIADEPCIESEGNAQIARRALEQEADKKVEPPDGWTSDGSWSPGG